MPVRGPVRGVLPLLLGAILTSEVAAQAQNGANSFDDFVRQVEVAQVHLVRGDPRAFKALWSQRDDVTLVGGLGGAIEKGWGRVSERLDWVSTQYTAGERRHEEISRFVGQDIAHVVQRETIRFKRPGESQETVQELRATMVFRLEAGAWRIIHRHADSQILKTPQPPRNVSRSPQPVTSIHTAVAMSSAPLIQVFWRGAGASFSKATNAVSAAMTVMFMTPPANSSSIKAQQQPTQ